MRSNPLNQTWLEARHFQYGGTRIRNSKKTPMLLWLAPSFYFFRIQRKGAQHENGCPVFEQQLRFKTIGRVLARRRHLFTPFPIAISNEGGMLFHLLSPATVQLSTNTSSRNSALVKGTRRTSAKYWHVARHLSPSGPNMDTNRVHCADRRLLSTSGADETRRHSQLSNSPRCHARMRKVSSRFTHAQGQDGSTGPQQFAKPRFHNVIESGANARNAFAMRTHQNYRSFQHMSISLLNSLRL